MARGYFGILTDGEIREYTSKSDLISALKNEELDKDATIIRGNRLDFTIEETVIKKPTLTIVD